jgi:geranylgeranyl pyrophosphate synthase
MAMGKLTVPVLLVWERANETERENLRGIVDSWQNGSLKSLTELFGRYDALNGSCAIAHQYLSEAREFLKVLPASDGRGGLFGLTEYLAHQTSALADRR